MWRITRECKYMMLFQADLQILIMLINLISIADYELITKAKNVADEIEQ